MQQTNLQNPGELENPRTTGNPREMEIQENWR
jgi:hypothetical protein